MFFSWFRFSCLSVVIKSLVTISMLACSYSYAGNKVRINIDGQFAGVHEVEEKTGNKLLLPACARKEGQVSDRFSGLLCSAIQDSFPVFEELSRFIQKVHIHYNVTNLDADVDPDSFCLPDAGCFRSSTADGSNITNIIVYKGEYKFKGEYLCLTGLISRAVSKGETDSYEPYAQVEYYFDRRRSGQQLTQIDIMRNNFCMGTPVECSLEPSGKNYIQEGAIAGLYTIAGICFGFAAFPYIKAAPYFFGLYGFISGAVIGREADNNSRVERKNRELVKAINNRLLSKAKDYMTAEYLTSGRRAYYSAEPVITTSFRFQDRMVVDEENADIDIKCPAAVHQRPGKRR